MGYNTPILVMNDALKHIEQNAEQFVKELTQACLVSSRERTDIPAGNYVNAATSLRTDHASFPRVLLSHGNLLTELGERTADVTRALQDDERFWRNEMIRRARRAREVGNATLRALHPTPEEMAHAIERHWE